MVFCGGDWLPLDFDAIIAIGEAVRAYTSYQRNIFILTFLLGQLKARLPIADRLVTSSASLSSWVDKFFTYDRQAAR
jgi:hypothetical protein